MLPDIISKLFQWLIAAHEYVPTRSIFAEIIIK